ncbi:helix-turn-helix domain-containing protein [Halobacterium wangiae]|uniref:helix-turn-helix domain-containing protein n=1 Tax=Halobacterium wangiae TaxID=2902623 RepID=UPI001E59A3AC|nr:helix-turn-helix domain-containing protein [Halobacterium wangiae]
MSVMAEFTVPASEFVLAETLTSSPEMRIEIKRVVGGTEFVTPYFWATEGDFETFEEALRADDNVRDLLTLEEHEEPKEATDRTDEERFYRVTWGTNVPNLVTAVSDSKATVLEAVSGDGGEWEVKVLFPDETALSEFHDYISEHDFDLDVTRVYRPDNPQEQAEYGLTAAQQEALEAAYNAGYFAVPRDRTLTELAEDLGISRNALSTRLRRGHRNLLANTVLHEQ